MEEMKSNEMILPSKMLTSDLTSYPDQHPFRLAVGDLGSTLHLFFDALSAEEIYPRKRVGQYWRTFFLREKEQT